MADARPLAFLFTDIEGSTRRWEAEPEAMAAALARHDALVRTAIETSGGRVFKTIGDAFCAAFDEAADALAAAHAAQRALEGHDWSVVAQDFAPLRARMAVHAGLVQARDDDYFGPTLNRVARLLAAGHGGQVLCSGAAYALAAPGLPADLTLRELGEHRLKDLDRAERIFQLDPEPPPDGWPLAFPPLRTLDAVPGNLPIQLSSFVGREREMAALRAMVAEHRLVTVTGIGGTGKTRLALQVAADLADGFIDGVWFVDLAPRTDDESAAAAAAAALGVRDDPSQPTEDVVADYLRDRRALLLLDNCEHLVVSSARFAAALLARCPGVRILATSREPLGIVGERVVALPPLDVPPLVDGASNLDHAALAHLGQFEAVRLFLERATDVQPAFAVDAATAPAVAEICHRLDGIPLAIELAAARIRTLAPADIARRLDARFRLLTGGGRDRLPRQQTLENAIAWSYDLLSEAEQRVLERFSVFSGAVPLDAADVVCAGDGVDAAEVLDVVDGLVSKSLVVARDVRCETWFAMLETVRSFAAAALDRRDEVLATRARQLTWYANLGDAAEVVRMGAEADVWIIRLQPLMNDVRAALAHARDDARLIEGAVRACESLWWLLFDAPRRGTLEIVSALIDALHASGSQEAHPRLLWLGSYLANHMGRPTVSLRWSGEALPLAVAAGDGRLASWILGEMGEARVRLGDLDSAAAHFREALAAKQAVGDDVDAAISLINLGEVERMRGNVHAAAELYQHAADALPDEETGSWVAAYAYHNLGQVLLHLGEARAARAALHRALRSSRTNLALLGYCLYGLAGVAALLRDGLLGARLVGAATAILRTTDSVPEPNEEDDRARHESLARALLTPAEWDAAFAEGQAMTPDEAIAFALAASGTPAEALS